MISNNCTCHSPYPYPLSGYASHQPSGRRVINRCEVTDENFSPQGWYTMLDTKHGPRVGMPCFPRFGTRYRSACCIHSSAFRIWNSLTMTFWLAYPMACVAELKYCGELYSLISGTCTCNRCKFNLQPKVRNESYETPRQE